MQRLRRNETGGGNLQMRILLEYTRGERVKYISHLDLMRAMQ
ncbi:MAG: DUF2344 domain-containing protein, partial [Clostridiales bacterium]|nr:DUF2344 domain-containing protein [Clostridiales bacterium]